MRGRIICGFAGIGKSTLAKKIAGVIDLENTPFKKDWKRYVKVASHMANNGYIVLLSCHKELRNELIKQGVQYEVVIPDKEDKEIYLQRYRSRGDSSEFITMMKENWYSFFNEIAKENNYTIISGDDYLANYF